MIEVGDVVLYENQLHVVVSVYDPDYEHNKGYNLVPYKEIIFVHKHDVKKVIIEDDDD